MKAVVTGATSGIGKAITDSLLERGESVVAAGRTASQRYQVQPRLLPVDCDLLEDGAVDRLFQQTMAVYGDVDLLFVNAGVIESGLVQTNLHAQWKVHPKDLLNISHTLQPEDIADAIIDVLEKPSHVRVPKVMLLPKGHKI